MNRSASVSRGIDCAELITELRAGAILSTTLVLASAAAPPGMVPAPSSPKVSDREAVELAWGRMRIDDNGVLLMPTPALLRIASRAESTEDEVEDAP